MFITQLSTATYNSENFFEFIFPT